METEPPAEQTAKPKPKLRWYQFSLRSLLIFVTLFGIACSWFTVKMGQAKRQKEAAEALVHKAYLRVYYDYQIDAAGKTLPDAQPPGPEWLLELLGKDFFCTAIMVQENCNTTGDPEEDTHIEPIKQLSQLRELNLAAGHLTDAGLVHIQGLRHLCKLDLSHMDITDAGLSRLAEMSELEWLRLENTHITDAGILQLKELGKLRALNLTHNNISDAGLETLAEMKQLESLRLGRTSVSDAGVRRLKKAIPKLTIYR